MSDHGQSTSSSQAAKNADKKGNGSKVLIIILLVLVLVALGVIIYLLTKKPAEEPKESRGVVLTEENASDVLTNEPVQDGYYQTAQTIDWHFKGKTSEDAYVANDVANSRTVYFDLMLEDTKEILYSSPYIPVGSEMKGLTLDKELDPGTYSVVMVYHLVDDDENEVSSLNVGLNIYVE